MQVHVRRAQLALASPPTDAAKSLQCTTQRLLRLGISRRSRSPSSSVGCIRDIARIVLEVTLGTLTKFSLGLMGRLRPKPAIGEATASIALPAPDVQGGMSLLDALRKRASRRDFSDQALPDGLLSGLLWAAYGINRTSEGGRTAPSALNSQEVDIFLALPSGAYCYEAKGHRLNLAAAADLRRITGYQDFVDTAPLDLVYVADYARMSRIPVTHRISLASVAAGAIAQNVYLFCASAGLSSVLRAWIDREAIADALGLTHDQHVLLSHTVGFPRAP
jgi:nitroreductase